MDALDEARELGGRDRRRNRRGGLREVGWEAVWSAGEVDVGEVEQRAHPGELVFWIVGGRRSRDELAPESDSPSLAPTLKSPIPSTPLHEPRPPITRSTNSLARSCMPHRIQKPAVVVPLERPLLALGLEGSANKLGVGLVLHSPSPDTPEGTVSILSNIRHTYVTPPGEGFLPSDTARHHKRWATEVVAKALESAGKTMDQVDVVCFTQG